MRNNHPHQLDDQLDDGDDDDRHGVDDGTVSHIGSVSHVFVVVVFHPDHDNYSCLFVCLFVRSLDDRLVG